MENSIFNAKASSSFSRTADHSSEESSWTSYLEDFILSQKKPYSASRSDDQTDRVLGYGSSSSLTTDRMKNDREKVVKKSCHGLSFRKRKKREGLVDEALEDTAISPLSSPKISDLHRRKEKTLNFKQKVGRLYREREDNHCTESSLKKKGLCLVPLSMAVNYFG